MATYHFSVKSGKRGKAKEHSTYIAREGKYGKGGKQADLVVAMHGNLPEWANDNPTEFWRMADQNERANGAAYRELVLALPVELTKEQNQKLIQDFIRDELGSKAHQVAIHMPKAALGDSYQPHAHIMYSDRVDDGIPREPQQFFRRYNPKHPEQGGCRKDSGGRDRLTLRNEVIDRRERWAECQNEHLANAGHSVRVDARSHRERGFERAPETHLGQREIARMSDEERSIYMVARRQLADSRGDVQRVGGV